jgi:serine/threonine protein kinase
MIKRIKLIDFGFGVFKDKLKDLSAREKFAGTPGFIAPEVYEAKEYDERIDTFSLGIILYFMLYGYLPFQSNFIEEIQ